MWRRSPWIAYKFAAGLACLVATVSLLVVGHVPISEAALGDATQLEDLPILFETNRNGSSDIYAMDARGRGQRPVVTGPDAEEAPHWAPDGRAFAFTSDRDGTWQIYVQALDGRPVQITRGDNSNVDPSWSPDGTQVAFETNRDRNWQIYVMNADGSNQRRVSGGARNDFDAAWNPDGRRVAFARVARRSADIYQVDVDTGKRERLTETRSAEFEPAFSPSGDQLAFSRDVRRNYDIYVLNFANRKTRRLTHARTVDESPSFSPNGQIVLFTSEQHEGDREVERISTRRFGRLNLSRRPRRDDSAADWRRAPARSGRVARSGRATRPSAVVANHFPYTCGDPASTGSTPTYSVEHGDGGKDRLCGDGGRNWLRGFGGRDHLDARHERDKCDGGRKADWIYAKDSEEDKLYGGTLTSSGHKDFSKRDWARIDKHVDVLRGIDRPR